MKKYIHFFGEYAFYSNATEEDEAKTYLQYWKKNLLQKLSNDNYSPSIVDEQYIIRDPMVSGILAERWKIALKISVTLEFNFEIHNYFGTAEINET